MILCLCASIITQKEVIPIADIFDIAAWFLSKERMTHKKVQKLCYYAVAWSWAICPEPLIPDAVFEAWKYGPVCPDLYDRYRDYGYSYIPKGEKPDVFSAEEEEFLEDVWVTYGGLTGNSLQALTRTEMPWQKARLGLDPADPDAVQILPEDMRSYYRSISVSEDV